MNPEIQQLKAQINDLNIKLNRIIRANKYLFMNDIELFNGKNIIVSSGDGTKIGTATTQKLGFYNATPIIQRSSADQTAVATTAPTQTTPYGFSTLAQATAIITLQNELRAAMVALGLIKGSS